MKQLDQIDIVGINRFNNSELGVIKDTVANRVRLGDVRYMHFKPKDTVVSPANTKGFMGGKSVNIDAAYREMFGSQIQTRVQAHMRELYGDEHMPFGEAFRITTYADGHPPPGKPGYLIVSPTVLYQELDMPPKATPDIAGKAMAAVLGCAGWHDTERLFIPPLGMGSAIGVKDLLPKFREAFIEAYDDADLFLYQQETGQ